MILCGGSPLFCTLLFFSFVLFLLFVKNVGEITQGRIYVYTPFSPLLFLFEVIVL